jgi:putative acetyltransferase
MTPPSDPTLRPERMDDVAQVRVVQSAAFGRSDEADLVDVLRAAATPILSLVAQVGGLVVGHVCFSPVTIEGCPEAPALAGLAPLAVLPAFQGRGVGGALVREGVRECASLGWRAIFLLGDPDYYGRFGFELAAARGFHYESERFDPHFQVLELEAGVLVGCAGQVRYHDAFAGL